VKSDLVSHDSVTYGVGVSTLDSFASALLIDVLQLTVLLDFGALAILEAVLEGSVMVLRVLELDNRDVSVLALDNNLLLLLLLLRLLLILLLLLRLLLILLLLLLTIECLLSKSNCEKCIHQQDRVVLHREELKTFDSLPRRTPLNFKNRTAPRRSLDCFIYRAIERRERKILE
jgi:hypothetical protein